MSPEDEPEVRPAGRMPAGATPPLPWGPEERLREIFAFGDRDAMKERLRAFAERGITTLVLTPIGADLIDEPAP